MIVSNRGIGVIGSTRVSDTLSSGSSPGSPISQPTAKPLGIGSPWFSAAKGGELALEESIVLMYEHTDKQNDEHTTKHILY